ncbi:hypothetical protein ABOM_002083 [Aspergillus bombycis]|uniref:Uncharacterized protein n=1 Tax=Aspergillus bombycis TaxID=109264 RepID=A0A1F8AA21_9EURO|nr:hypothetical protein ABOM_002083 [Aspergillus bombycis]OGM48178.1 hypothetical protein ABOM_002083 [Aspergillus bombycis]
MLHIDQQIGAGLSHGVEMVVSTYTADKYVWKIIRGHYGPGFAAYILKQNLATQQGKETGEEINLVALGVNNGFTHAADVYKSYIDYAMFARAQQVPEPDRRNAACVAASVRRYELIQGPIASTASFDVRALTQDPNPPSTYSKYLLRLDVVNAISARSLYPECPMTAYGLFSATGDRYRSYIQ